MMRELCAFSCVLLLGACSGELPFMPDSDSQSDSDTGAGSGGGDGSGTTSPAVASACKKVDLIFSVDDSVSMTEEMDAMREIIFPAFATELINIGDGLDDYRVGVIDACPQPASFNTRGDGGMCNFEGGNPWMESSSSSLVNEFSCVGDIYSGDVACSGDNDDEQPASAVAKALSGSMVSGGGANAGFLRDDALLVVIAITDEDEQPTPDATAQQVYDQLVAIKGDVNKIVFLGIGGKTDCVGVYGTAYRAQRLAGVTQLFVDRNQGLFWDLCVGHLEDGLAAAMGVIESACEDFDDPNGGDGGGDGGGGDGGGGNGGGDGGGGPGGYDFPGDFFGDPGLTNTTDPYECEHVGGDDVCGVPGGDGGGTGSGDGSGGGNGSGYDFPGTLDGDPDLTDTIDPYECEHVGGDDVCGYPGGSGGGGGGGDPVFPPVP